MIDNLVVEDATIERVWVADHGRAQKREAERVGVQRIASKRPTGPARKRLRASWEMRTKDQKKCT